MSVYYIPLVYIIFLLANVLRQSWQTYLGPLTFKLSLLLARGGGSWCSCCTGMWLCNSPRPFTAWVLWWVEELALYCCGTALLYHPSFVREFVLLFGGKLGFWRPLSKYSLPEWLNSSQAGLVEVLSKSSVDGFAYNACFSLFFLLLANIGTNRPTKETDCSIIKNYTFLK